MRVLVTGASGWIGSAVVPELLAAEHEVVGLARSDASAAALTVAGVEVLRGDLDDVEGLATAAAAADGVVHLAFRHDLAFTGDFPGAVRTDRLALEAMGAALAGSGKPLLIASGTLGLAPGRLAIEEDGRAAWTGPSAGGAEGRLANAQLVLALADRGVRSSVVRLPPTVHGDGDGGFLATLVAIARDTGVSAYVGDGAQRWPAVHRSDAAVLFRRGLESAPAGSVLHAVDDEGVALRDVAEVMGRHLGLPVEAIAVQDAPAHFSYLAGFLGTDSPASAAATRALLGWEPVGPGLVEDLELGHYFRSAVV